MSILFKAECVPLCLICRSPVLKWPLSFGKDWAHMWSTSPRRHVCAVCPCARVAGAAYARTKRTLSISTCPLPTSACCPRVLMVSGPPVSSTLPSWTHGGVTSAANSMRPWKVLRRTRSPGARTPGVPTHPLQSSPPHCQDRDKGRSKARARA